MDTCIDIDTKDYKMGESNDLKRCDENEALLQEARIRILLPRGKYEYLDNDQYSKLYLIFRDGKNSVSNTRKAEGYIKEALKPMVEGNRIKKIGNVDVEQIKDQPSQVKILVVLIKNDGTDLTLEETINGI